MHAIDMLVMPLFWTLTLLPIAPIQQLGKAEVKIVKETSVEMNMDTAHVVRGTGRNVGFR